MDYITLFILICFMYYLINLKNKNILLIFLIIGFYLYREELLPKPFFELPIKTKSDYFNLDTLDDLIKRYQEDKNNYLLKLIKKEINTIYFSFPLHLHKKLDEQLYFNYGIKNRFKNEKFYIL